MKILDVPQTGSVGETVTYQSRFGIIRRQKVIPRDPRTALQLDRRTAFQRARQFWGTFTDEQFAAWNTLASTRRTHPVLGQSSGLSGYELAVQSNVHLATLGLRMVPTPRPVPVFPDGFRPSPSPCPSWPRNIPTYTPSIPPVFPLYSPCKPHVYPLY